VTDERVKIPQWGIGILVTALSAIVGVAVSWGAMSTRQTQVEESVKEVEKIVPVVAQQQVIIPEIQKNVEQVRVAQVAFNEKYDRNREQEQKMLMDILKEVKK
jgi:hypothetical protein